MGKEPGKVVSSNFTADTSSYAREKVELACQEMSGAQKRREDRLDKLAQPF